MTQIRIRRLADCDAEDFYQATNNDSMISHEFPAFFDKDQNKALEKFHKLLRKEYVKSYAICSATANFLGVVIVSEEIPKTIDISSFVIQEYRGKNVGYKALKEVLTMYPDYTARFVIDERNIAAQKIMLKIGAQCVARGEFCELYYEVHLPKEQNS